MHCLLGFTVPILATRPTPLRATLIAQLVLLDQLTNQLRPPAHLGIKPNCQRPELVQCVVVFVPVLGIVCYWFQVAHSLQLSGWIQ